MTILAIGIVLFLAYANGANDNFKPVATLYGAGTATYRGALTWTTVASVAGSIAALTLAQELVMAFSGKGLVPDSVTATPAFPLAVGLAAAATVQLATVLGFPISTTHALIGGLVGAGLFASPIGVDVGRLGGTFFAPLLLSPVLALLLAGGAYACMRLVRVWSGATRASCVCVGEAVTAAAVTPYGAMLPVGARVAAVAGPDLGACARAFPGSMVGVAAGPSLDRLHYVSAATVAFARALNDTPKIAAFLLVAGTLPPSAAILLVTALVAAGGLIHSRRIAETMGRKVTTMTPGQGLTANLVTGLLVIFATKLGLPVSTTHVACGSLFGVGSVARTARWRTVATILVAWVTTLPVAALLGALGYLAIQGLTR